MHQDAVTSTFRKRRRREDFDLFFFVSDLLIIFFSVCFHSISCRLGSHIDEAGRGFRSCPQDEGFSPRCEVKLHDALLRKLAMLVSNCCKLLQNRFLVELK